MENYLICIWVRDWSQNTQDLGCQSPHGHKTKRFPHSDFTIRLKIIIESIEIRFLYKNVWRITSFVFGCEIGVKIPRIWAANPHMGTKPKDSPIQTSLLGLKL